MNAFPYIRFLYSNLYGQSKKGTMETSHEVITRLKFITLIKPEEKIDVKNLEVQKNSIATAIYRMFSQESRENTLDFLTSTINRSFEIIQLCLLSDKSSDKTMCRHLCEDLVKSSVGLLNLQTTYKKDRLFWCHMQTLIEGIESKLKDLKDSHPELFPEENKRIEEEIKFG